MEGEIEVTISFNRRIRQLIRWRIGVLERNPQNESIQRITDLQNGIEQIRSRSTRQRND